LTREQFVVCWLQDGDVIVLCPLLHRSHNRLNLRVCSAVQHLYHFTQQIPANS